MPQLHPTAEHIKRIQNDLKRAGATNYGRLKLESRYLPKVIGENEQIGGLIYGRYEKGSAMLVATDRRVIFLDRMPFYTILKEITYDVVSGISQNIERPFFTSVTLHTRLGDFSLRFVNMKAAQIFVSYIESRRLEHLEEEPPKMTSSSAKLHTAVIPPDALQFLIEHDVAVLSTIDDDDKPEGAVVFYSVGDDKRLYMVTKSETAKARNLTKRPDVGLTVFDGLRQQTAQIKGTADIVNDQKVRQQIFDEIIRTRMYAPEAKTPPIAQIEAGSFVILAITVDSLKYRDFGGPTPTESITG